MRNLSIAFEPIKPLQYSRYTCDSIFHTEDLKKMLEHSDKYGFIIADGNGALFATLQGSTKVIIEKFTVDLPNKHGRGGQSQKRFERIREEKRHNYIRAIAETAKEHFISVDRPNVKGIIVAGSADIKTELIKSDLFDQRLKPVIMKIYDINYGGENGFNQTVEMSSTMLKNVRFVQEKFIIKKLWDEICIDSGKFTFGIKDTMQHLLNGTIETLIISEELDCQRIVYHDNKGNECVEFAKNINEISIDEADVIEKTPLVNWLIDNYKDFTNDFHIVTDCTEEGTQFKNSFSGIGGILRYKIEANYENDAPSNMLDDDFI